MPSRKRGYLSDFVSKQYPIDDYKKLIIISLDIVENFLIAIEGQYNYKAVSVNDYERRYGTSPNRNTSSKIESLLIKDMDTQEKMISFIESYFSAYHSLNEDEKKLFYCTFMEGLTDTEIFDKLKMYSKQVSSIRKSAIIKFCLKTGLNRFVDLVHSS